MVEQTTQFDLILTCACVCIFLEFHVNMYVMLILSRFSYERAALIDTCFTSFSGFCFIHLVAFVINIKFESYDSAAGRVVNSIAGLGGGQAASLVITSQFAMLHRVLCGLEGGGSEPVPDRP